MSSTVLTYVAHNELVAWQTKTDPTVIVQGVCHKDVT